MMGVLAYKSCFVFGRTGVCMGAGITDLKPEYGRNIRTTVNVAERLTDTLISHPQVIKNRLRKVKSEYGRRINRFT